MSGRKRQTFEKMNRERAVREKRARKQEKREQRRLEARGLGAGDGVPVDPPAPDEPTDT